MLVERGVTGLLDFFDGARRRDGLRGGNVAGAEDEGCGGEAAGEEVDGGEGVGSVDGYGDEGEEPEPAVGEDGDAGARPEVGECL